MEKKIIHILLEGSNHQVGETLGKICRSIPGFAEAMTVREAFLSHYEELKMYQLFDEFCPGINEELSGFAQELDIQPIQALYYAMTYLRPGCSQIAVLPSKTKNGHTLLARNYDFSDKADDFMLATTRIKGKYAHIGSTVMQFGRNEGMNEHGLAVSQTSAGLPVGNFDFAAKPSIVGLQFWAVIRSVLENCKNVEDAILWTEEMPIAYNINLLLADQSGEAALLETFNGEKSVKRIDGKSADQFLCSANHIHLPELKAVQPFSMKNSLKRYSLICDTINGKDSVSADDLKKLLTVNYPDGLRCRFYDDFFGTLRSIVFDVNDGTMEVCFGTPEKNVWHRFGVNEEILHQTYPVPLMNEKAPEDFYQMIKGN